MRAARSLNSTTPYPPGPQGLPYLGSLPAYRRDAAQFLTRTRYEHGPMAKLRMGPYTFTLATGPAAVQHVLIKNKGNYCRGQLYKQFELVMGRGLLTMDDDEWRPHRRVMQPAFLRSALAGYFPSVRERTEQLLTRWENHALEGTPVDLVAECLRLASAVIMDVLFGFDIDDRAARIKGVVDQSIDVMFPHGTFQEMLPLWVPSPRNRRVKRNREQLLNLADDVARSPAGTGEMTLDSLLRAATQRGEDGWSRAELRDEILTIYLAGHETTATAMVWSLISVANEPPVRERLDEEVDRVVGRRPVEYGDLESLTYTKAVIDETLRLYPPIWLFPRDAVNDDIVDGYRVDAKTSVLLSPLLSHRDPEVWTNPEAFDPDRFLAGAGRPPQGSYIPFGLGARQCVGNAVALVELQAVLAMITQRYRLEILPSSMLRYGDTLISLRPMGDVVARVHLRDKDGAA